jgi:hypothetical protein
MMVICWKTTNFRQISMAPEPEVQAAQDGGVVAGNIENFEPLEVQVTVQGLDEYLPRCEKNVEVCGSGGDSRVKFKVHLLNIIELGTM